MIEFETTILPPHFTEDAPSTLEIPSVIRQVVGNDLDAERIIRFGLQDYHKLAVAHRNETVYGFQIFDYDYHEIGIVLGKQVVSASLNPQDAQEVSKKLEQEALYSYEEF
jgi:hypothetical protein